jgi:hypothetical protein
VPVGGGVVARWIDTQMPGQFERAARPDDVWAALLAHPGAEILVLDPAGHPADLGFGRVTWRRLAAVLTAAAGPPGSAGPRGNVLAAALAPPGKDGLGIRGSAGRQPPKRVQGERDDRAAPRTPRSAATAAPDATGTRPLAGGLSYLVAGGPEKLPGRGVPEALREVAATRVSVAKDGAGSGVEHAGRQLAGGPGGRRPAAAQDEAGAVATALRSAMAQVAMARPWDGRTTDCAWRVGEVIRRLSEPLAAVDDFSALGETAGVARRLGGWFIQGDLGWLEQLRPGGITVVRVDRPDLRAHLVVVERLADGRLVMAETQARPGQARFVPFGPPAGVGREALPEILRGPLRLVASPSGGLAQLEPTGHAEGAGQRPYRVARGTTGPPPAAEAGGRTVAALVDPHAGAPGMKFSLPWRRRPPRGPVPGPADAALRDAAALRGDVATVFVRRHFARLDHRPVDELIARGGAEVVRIVPAGGLVLAARDLSRLGRRFAGTGRTVFVPGPGSRVAARQLDLVVVGPGSHAGSWVLLDGEMPGRGYATTGTGRLARDITTRDIDPGEGELVTWAAELVHPARRLRPVVRAGAGVRPGTGGGGRRMAEADEAHPRGPAPVRAVRPDYYRGLAFYEASRVHPRSGWLAARDGTHHPLWR